MVEDLKIENITLMFPMELSPGIVTHVSADMIGLLNPERLYKASLMGVNLNNIYFDIEYMYQYDSLEPFDKLIKEVVENRNKGIIYRRIDREKYLNEYREDLLREKNTYGEYLVRKEAVSGFGTGFSYWKNEITRYRCIIHLGDVLTLLDYRYIYHGYGFDKLMNKIESSPYIKELRLNRFPVPEDDMVCIIMPDYTTIYWKQYVELMAIKQEQLTQKTFLDKIKSKLIDLIERL